MSERLRPKSPSGFISHSVISRPGGQRLRPATDRRSLLSLLDVLSSLSSYYYLLLLTVLNNELLSFPVFLFTQS